MRCLTSVSVLCYVVTWLSVNNQVSGHPQITKSTINTMREIAPVNVTIAAVTTSTAMNPEHLKFRTDYARVSTLHAFYKLHRSPRNWYEAVSVCEDEGSTLMVPDSELEISHVRYMMSSIPSNQPAIYVGLHNLFDGGYFVNLEGTPLEASVHTWQTGEPNNLDGVEHCVVITRDGRLNDVSCYSNFLFICKKTLDSLTYNTACQNYDDEYIYNEEQSKCYKVHVEPKTWHSAFAACSSEGSYLAVINRDSEADFLVSLIDEHEPSPREDGFHIGFHNLFKQGDFRTIKGEKLSKAGYNRWSESEPDDGDDVRECGSILHDGSLDAIQCSTEAFYICEHDIGSSPDFFKHNHL